MCRLIILSVAKLQIFYKYQIKMIKKLQIKCFSNVKVSHFYVYVSICATADCNPRDNTTTIRRHGRFMQRPPALTAVMTRL